MALVGMVTLIVLVLMGVHIAVALGTVGFFGLVACLNLPKAVAMVGIQAYSGIATFDYAVIPLFILMGMLATGIGISTECYDTLAKWLGRIPGGLGVATTLGCTAFGTLNGSALVTGRHFLDRQPLLQNLPLFGHQLPGSQPGGQGIHVPHLLGAAQFPGFRCGDENHHQ